MLRALKFWGMFLGVLSVALLILGITVPMIIDNHARHATD